MPMDHTESGETPNGVELTPLARGAVLSTRQADQLAAELEERPDNAQGWYDLGCIYNREGRYDEAAYALECCLASSPCSLAAQGELAYALSGRGDLGEAGVLFESVINQDPGNGQAYFLLGMVRFRMNALHEAVEFWECAARLLEDPGDSLENLAMAYRRLDRPEQEKHCWERLRDFAPEHPAVPHMLAAQRQAPVPPRADDAYVRHLFGRFASDFDAVLRTLDYGIPDLLEARLRDTHGAPSRTLRTLDAGCGTGLCGERLRLWSRHLTGVDLSASMLAEARHRELYDDLIEGELVAFLRTRAGDRYDWIVAGDVLCYFGCLEDFIPAAAEPLAAGGRIFLTVEKDESAEAGTGPGYRLQTHGRYCHTQGYVEASARAAGLSVERISTEFVRYESGKPVKGICAVLLNSTGDRH